MATVEIKEFREQYSHFGLYRTSAGGQDFIIVRRKVGEPTDYLHANSRKLKRQREALSVASQHYATLTPSQKADTRQQMEEVEYIRNHGKTDIKLLKGRQLFISKDIRSLNQLGQLITPTAELCVFVCDPHHDLVEPETVWAILWNVLQTWRQPLRLSPGYYLWKKLDQTKESYQLTIKRDCWNDHLTPKLPLKDFKAIRYAVMDAGLLIIEHQPAYAATYAGEDKFYYSSGLRTGAGLQYHFSSKIQHLLPYWLTPTGMNVRMKELNPLQWEMHLHIPNSGFAVRDEPGTFAHSFRIYGRRTWAYVSEWRVISGESCFATDGSPPGTYDYLIYPPTLVKTTLP